MIKKTSVLLLVTALFAFATLAVTAVAGDTTGVQGAVAQDKCEIPTLGEWGLIIFSVLLVGWMAWVIVRRKKTADSPV